MYSDHGVDHIYMYTIYKILYLLTKAPKMFNLNIISQYISLNCIDGLKVMKNTITKFLHRYSWYEIVFQIISK